MKEKITLSLDQHENARHGEEIFPLQKYVTPLWKEYPYVTAHWHEEAEFTRIGKGSCTYQIHLETYDVEEGDLIFIPPAVLHAISNEKEERMQSETYVFHMDFLGAKTADICAIRYLNPLMNQKLIPPFVIKKGHPLYEKAADLFEDINTEYDKKTPGYEIAIKSYLLQLVAALIPYCTRNTEADAILTDLENQEKREASLPASRTDSQKVSEQMSLFVEETENPVLTELRDLDIYNMTPLEVMAAVAELKKKL